MKRTFPTIKQMAEAIEFAMCDVNGRVNYQQESHSFLAVELIPFPCYDSGGGLDSIDFEEKEHHIPFQEAYNYWVAMNDFLNGTVTPIPVPVCPHYAYPEFEYEDLPF